MTQQDYRALCAELVNNIYAGQAGQMGWTNDAEDALLKRAAEACGSGYFTTTAWNIITQAQ